MSRSLLAFAVLLLASAPALAREGDLDHTFAFLGEYTQSFNQATSGDDEALRTFVDHAGRYVIVGTVANNKIAITRRFPNGVSDTTFGSTGTVVYPLPGNSIVADATMDAVDRVVITGYALNPLDNDPFVCRYENGSPDPNIGTNGCRVYTVDFIAGGDDRAYAVTTDATGNIFLAGQVQLGAEDTDFLIMRLKAFDAAPASTFGSGGIVSRHFDISPAHSGGDNDVATSILLVGNKLFVGGSAVSSFGDTDFAILKASAIDGELDPTFCLDTTVCPNSAVTQGRRSIGYNYAPPYNDVIRSLALAPDGTILIAGEASEQVGPTPYVAYEVTRINQDGTFPPGTFAGATDYHDVVFPGLEVHSVIARSDGKFLLGGNTAGGPGAPDPHRYLWATQFGLSGLPETAFSTNGGSPGPDTLLAFDTLDNGQPTDHRGGTLTLDRGRILLTGAGLWRRDVDAGVNDFDFAVARLHGDSIFLDGFGF